MFKTFWPSAYLVSLNDGNTFEYRLRLAAPPFNINCFLSLSAFLGLLSGGCCGNKAWMSLFRCFGVINTAVLDKKTCPFFPNGPVTATKAFVSLVLCNIQSQVHNFQNAKSENGILKAAQINMVSTGCWTFCADVKQRKTKMCYWHKHSVLNPTGIQIDSI